VLFSKDGPHAWNTKKGDSRLDHEIQAVVDAKGKSAEARASVSEVIEKEKFRHGGVQTETV
jgi:uncharacterized protein YdaU (DUF1376 family)